MNSNRKFLTVEIDDELRRKMKVVRDQLDLNWSSYIRKAIEQRIQEAGFSKGLACGAPSLWSEQR